MKKLLSMMLVLLVFGLTLAGCNKDTVTTEADKDTINPLLKVVPTDVTVMFEEDYDLMSGVEATDNLDGNITSTVTVEQGDYNNQVAGQYVITYRVSDSSGNEVTATRNITVSEKTSVVSVDGKQYPMVYNPLLNPKFLMGTAQDENGNKFENPWHFDLTKVSVFSKDYFDWLYVNYPNRLYAGWTNIAVTDADGKIVLLREHTCNQYTEENGNEACSDWSNGTFDNEYKDLHAGFANLTVPDGGHVVVFINDGANEDGSPRSFGDALTLGGAGLGKTIDFLHAEPVVDHEKNQLPVITVPEADFIKTLLVGDAFDVMEGVTVTDKEDTDVTLNTKILKFDGTVYGEVTEVTTTEPSIYIIEHSADYDGVRKVTARREVVVVTEIVEDDFITVGNEDIIVVENPAEWATYYNVNNGHLYTKAFWDTIDQSKLVCIEDGHMYQGTFVIVIDHVGRVIEIRDALTGFEYTVDNPTGIKATTWTVGTPTKDLVVPENGYVLAYFLDKEVGYKAFIHSSGVPQAGVTDVNAIGKIVEGKWFSDFITVGEEDILVVENPAEWPTYYSINKAQLYTKTFWDAIDQSQLVNIGVGNMYQSGGLLIVLDQFGTVVEIRDTLLGFEYTEANPGGIAATSWEADTPTKNLVVPENGYVLAYWATKDDGYKTFVHTEGKDVGQGATDVNAIGTVVEGKWFPDFITVGEENIIVVENPVDWATYYTVNNGHLYTKAFWDAIDQSQLVNIGNGNMYQGRFVIVLDATGKVVEIRDGFTGFEYTVDNPTGVKGTTWETDTPTKDLVVPENGYVLAYFLDEKVGYKAFIHSSGLPQAGVTDVNAIGTKVEGKWFSEVVEPEHDYITVGNEDILVVVNPVDWANYYTIQGSHLYTKAFWDAIDQTKLNNVPNGELYNYSVLVVLDEFGQVVEIRDGLATDEDTIVGYEFTATNPEGIKSSTWTRKTPTKDLVVPENGYVLAFTKIGEDATWRTEGYKAFVHTSGSHTTAPGTTDVNAIGTIVEGEWFAEVVAPHITVGTEDILVVENPVDWANYYTIQGSHLYTKVLWDAIDQTQLNNIPEGQLYQYSVLVVLDETGKVVEIRDALAQTGEDFGFVFNEANPTGIAATWTRKTPTKDLVVPENGYVLAFTGINGDYTWRTAGYTAFIHTSGSHEVGLGTTDVNAVGNITVVLPE